MFMSERGYDIQSMCISGINHYSIYLHNHIGAFN